MEQLQMSYGSVQRMLKIDLKLKKKACKLVPHLLTDHDKQRRLNFATSLLRAHADNPGILDWILTTDKSWFYVYDPGSKIENMRWLAKGQEHPEIVRREMSVKKCMFIPFFDRRGLLFWEFFQNETIKKEVFKPLLHRVRQVIRTRRGVAVWRRRDEYHLHMDNAPCHRAGMVQKFHAGMGLACDASPAIQPGLVTSRLLPVSLSEKETERESLWHTGKPAGSHPKGARAHHTTAVAGVFPKLASQVFAVH